MNPPQRAWLSIEGLSIGDAFGQYVLRSPGPAQRVLASRTIPPGPWRYSDDTMMALSVVEVLEERSSIDGDALAAAFARRFVADPSRGYGAVARAILTRIATGQAWSEVAREPYGGAGSMGNGAAMRVAPVGAWFVEDEREVVRQAIRSAEVTHAHAEGQAGAVAVALAAVAAWRARRDPRSASFSETLAWIAKRTPEGETQCGLREAARMKSLDPEHASRALGDGSRVIASDTVPYALWCACTSLADFEGSLWRAMAGLLEEGADRDTICAIVGSVVVLSTGRDAIPAAWLSARETLSHHASASNS